MPAKIFEVYAEAQQTCKNNCWYGQTFQMHFSQHYNNLKLYKSPAFEVTPKSCFL